MKLNEREEVPAGTWTAERERNGGYMNYDRMKPLGVYLLQLTVMFFQNTFLRGMQGLYLEWRMTRSYIIMMILSPASEKENTRPMAHEYELHTMKAHNAHRK